MQTGIVINDIQVNLIAKDGKVFATSLDVAKVFEKEHKHVLEKIKKFNERARSNFRLKSYLSKNNKELPMYEMNRDGFSFLVMGFTGEKADNFKLDFIDGFNRLEELESKKNQIILPNKIELAQMVIESEQKVAKLETTITQKDELIKTVAELNIKAGEVTFANFAKNLSISGMGRNNIINFCKARGYLRDNREPYQPYVNRGYFVRRPSKEEINGEVRYTTHLTPRGTVWLARIIRAEFEIDEKTA